MVQTGKHQRDPEIDHSGGHRYPHLEPVPGARHRLDEILTPSGRARSGELHQRQRAFCARRTRPCAFRNSIFGQATMIDQKVLVRRLD